MGIEYIEKYKTFKLTSLRSTYMIGIIDDEGLLGHIYYGKRIEDDDLTYLLRLNEYPYVPSKNNRDRLSIIDRFMTEYSTHGVGDFRESCLKIDRLDGTSACHIVYKEHKIYSGKEKLSGLPSSFGSNEECTSLELVCTDPVLNIDVILSYTVFEKKDVITRSVRVINSSKEALYIDKIMSLCLDFEGMDFDTISLHGSWARERHIQRRQVDYGKFSVSSIRGESSHQDHPFMAVVSRETSQTQGEVYGFNFVYSGNFVAQIEGTQYNSVRFVMGINPNNFRWKLEVGEEFTAPEVVMVYSDQGLDGMTKTFHDFYRAHLIRGKYWDVQRPVLINNWEATYFDFDTEKLLGIAKNAAESGIEMLVMDDGWFGKRNDDNSSLGDWVVNEEKIKGGLSYLVDEVNKQGMKFGIWFEPEMISPNSDLYREHPDWAIQIKGRTSSLSRNQLVLDMSRQEVRDVIYERIKKIMKSANIEYVKWDMNRALTDLGSSSLLPERQGELSHRYMLGVYEMLERFTEDFPDILLEGCSGGGARFDPGMLYYCPQIWCSDDTDGIERLRIQEGTSLIYPLSTIGSHVSDCPNHVSGRTIPFETRGYIALAGTFGYELDITKIKDEEKKQIPGQIALCHKFSELIREGDYYRLSSYGGKVNYDSWEVVSKDKSEVLVFFIQIYNKANSRSVRLKLKGLDAVIKYKAEEEEQVYSGGALMYAGINIESMSGDFRGKLLHFIKC